MSKQGCKSLLSIGGGVICNFTPMLNNAHQSQIIGGDAEENHTQIIGGGYSQIMGNLSPQVLAPLCPRVLLLDGAVI